MSSNPPQMPRSTTTEGLNVFVSILRNFGSLFFWAVSLPVAVSMSDFFFQFGPPIPGMPIITSIAQFVTLIYVFHFWFNLSETSLNRLMKLSLLLLIVGFILYWIWQGTYIDFYNSNPPGTRTRYIRYGGYIKDPSSGPAELPMIDSYLSWIFGTSPNALVTYAGAKLMFAWLLSFTGLASFIAIFIMIRHKHSSV